MFPALQGVETVKLFRSCELSICFWLLKYRDIFNKSFTRQTQISGSMSCWHSFIFVRLALLCLIIAYHDHLLTVSMQTYAYMLACHIQ
jgi:hypothetical protein